jgi:hypothetical protein
MLGASNGSLLHNLLLIFANSLWTILLTPLFLPLIIRVRKMLMSNRERI